MLQAIALDDDRSALTLLDAYCQRAGGITLSQTFTRPHQARQFLQTNQVDLVFMETQLAGESCFDFWQSIGRLAADTHTMLPGLIFTTDQYEYAVQSYDLQALDYLLKPVSFERFSRSVKKATDRLTPQWPTPLWPALQHCFRVDYGLVTVNLAEITCVEALGNYCKLYLVDQRPLVIRSTMKALLRKLPALGFMQVHRSYIVATKYIQSLRNKQICLVNKKVPVGINYEHTVQVHFAGSSHSSQV